MGVARPCLALCVVAAGLLGTGCGGSDAQLAATATTDGAARREAPRTAAEPTEAKPSESKGHPCVSAREAIAAGSELFAAAARAPSEGLVPHARAALGEWADRIRLEGERAQRRAADPLLAEGLTQMADGLDAATHRIRSVDDVRHAGRLLETDELVIASEKIVAVCAEHLPSAWVPDRDR